jgi:hypothetical protein
MDGCGWPSGDDDGKDEWIEFDHEHARIFGQSPALTTERV